MDRALEVRPDSERIFDAQLNINHTSFQTFHVWLPSFRRFTAKQFTNSSAHDASGMLTPFQRFRGERSPLKRPLKSELRVVIALKPML
ncbi:MAG TPA: hypothetical protein VLL54_16475 [Pyrinomonadaceae bacterium]|nr:hypothetical protein [Pyrinomonadaceae bacterium]